jgi:glutathione S-transferase
VAYRVRTYGLQLNEIAAAYAGRLIGLGAMREWEAAALAEPWREESHELEVLAAGEIVADHRHAEQAASE